MMTKRELANLVGKNVDIDTPSRMACGRKITDGPCPHHSPCREGILFGASGLLVSVRWNDTVTGEQVWADLDWGMSVQIEDDTTVVCTT